jgi:hypothetical protein
VQPRTLERGHTGLDDDMLIELSEEQSAELHSLRESALGDLSTEIADTDNAEYRQGRRQRRTVLESVLFRLDNHPRACD